jgi:tRNA(Arg) A34 adenosine deaminase TadA
MKPASRENTLSFMSIALEEARAAAALGEVPVGAVLVAEGRILARTGNRMITQNDPTAHAEMLALRAGAALIGSARLDAAHLYVTLEPCAMCTGAIALARIARLYYGAPDPKGGAVEHGPRFFSQATCHHRPDVYSGFAEEESARLLREFFAARRG